MCRLFKAKYYRRGNLPDSVFSGTSSAVWKAIEYGLELVKKGAIWRAGMAWIPCDMSRHPLSERGNSRFTRVSSFVRADGSWDVDRLTESFIPDDVEGILKIKLSPR